MPSFLKLLPLLILNPTLTPLRAQQASTPTTHVEPEPSLLELVDEANKALRGNSSRARLAMTISTPQWERRMEVEGWNQGREMAFIRILAPAKEKGTITLRRKNEMWVWMPKVERVIKIPPTMMHSSWQGSDFTYEDIVKADSIVKDYDHKLLEKNQEKERVVYKVEAVPKPDAPVVWGKVILWAALYPGSEAVPLREDDYSERGELVRSMAFSEIKRMGGRLVPSRLECLPVKKNKEKTSEKERAYKTVISYQELEFDLAFDENFFSLSRLQKGIQ
ncbi:MAG: outer membrane lipoprotein-sorting protein [Elusimicrobia bacterium]|nr:outer membrane lipoprotein-sorting protein [Elusimicrobiota bacterium]